MIVGLIRLACVGYLCWFAVLLAAPIAMGVVSNMNMQDCWKKHGVTFACKGDGRYDDRMLNQPYTR